MGVDGLRVTEGSRGGIVPEMQAMIERRMRQRSRGSGMKGKSGASSGKTTTFLRAVCHWPPAPSRVSVGMRLTA